jgi:hypothetical protein
MPSDLWKRAVVRHLLGLMRKLSNLRTSPESELKAASGSSAIESADVLIWHSSARR